MFPDISDLSPLRATSVFYHPQIPLPLANMLSPITSTIFSLGLIPSSCQSHDISLQQSIVPFRAPSQSFLFPLPVPGSPDSFSKSFPCLFLVLWALRQIPFFPPTQQMRAIVVGSSTPLYGQAVQGWD